MAESPVNSSDDIEGLKAKVAGVLKTIFDPEIPVNIYEMGLIYDINIGEARAVDVRMTLTSPACPVAGSLPGEVESKIRALEGVGDVNVELVWEPAWTPDRMSDAAKLQLNMDLGPPPSPRDDFRRIGRLR